MRPPPGEEFGWFSSGIERTLVGPKPWKLSLPSSKVDLLLIQRELVGRKQLSPPSLV